MVRFGRVPHEQPSPSALHTFVEPADARSGLALGSVQPGLQMASPVTVADASLRAARCALSGCGKDRDDPVHAPSE